MHKIIIEELIQKPIQELEVEIVERKGRGHPDFIADIACESVCKALCRYYKENFDVILHHNVDKGLVVGGRANPIFGGGEVIEPIQIFVAGRAITEVIKEGKYIPVPATNLAIKAIRDSLRKTFRFLDIDHHVIIMPIIRRGSADLIKVFELGKKVPLANDTSFGVCFAPLSELERLVLETERYLNSKRLKQEMPEVGEDIKVLGVREKDRISLTVSAAIISKLTKDLSHYLSIKEEIKNRIADFSSKLTEKEVEVYINVADKPEEGSVYLTVTGTSAEAGDDGNTGRSNRIHGLITPCRQMSLEAVAGKNPINHVGKVYNVLAKYISDRIYREVKGVKEVYVKVLSQIGVPIDNPFMTHIQLILEKGISLDSIRSEVLSIAKEEIGNVTKITETILREEIPLF